MRAGAKNPAGAERPRLRRFTGVLAFAAALLLMIAGLASLSAPAQAQFWGWGGRGGWDQPPRPSRPVQQQRQQRRPQQQDRFGLPFFFGGRGGGQYQQPAPRYDYPVEEPRAPRQQQQRVDTSRAPAPRRTDSQPAKSVLVLGDSMADWLAYGLEDAFAEAEEIGVVRKSRVGSSLLRNETRDYDWLTGARDALAGSKADFVVMMIGLGDRHSIRERQAAKSATPGQAPSADEERRAGSTVHEFRSEKWVELYSKRVDEVMAVLKARKVPVFWVGLPPIRGPRARGDLVFLNELFKERAARAGVTYIDVWEGFVDESGEYSQFGPDVLGQVRRLRSGDGVHFTRYGARKLAHFVDREIKRLTTRDTPVALPIPDEPSTPAAPSGPSGPAARPVAGPVVPLTGGTPAAEALLGARPQDAQAGDPLALRVLVNGEPPQRTPGRADNFTWPPVSSFAANDVAPPPPEAVAAAPARPAKPAAQTVTRRPGQRAAARNGAAAPVQ